MTAGASPAAPPRHPAADSSAPALVAQGLTKDFGGFRAVSDVNLSVAHGSIHALIGPNGAGKTTCFNLLTKFLQPTRGTITFGGHDITREQPWAVAALGLVRSFQISAIFPQHTARDNVRMALQRQRGGSYDFWRSDRLLNRYNDRAMEALEEVGLTEMASHMASELSYGRRRALELATTLALEPRMLLLDEPMAGMGSEDVARMSGLIRRASRGRTVLMVEHNLSVVADLCDRITVLARGEVIAEGSYPEVSRDPTVRTAYIGGEHD